MCLFISENKVCSHFPFNPTSAMKYSSWIKYSSSLWYCDTSFLRLQLFTLPFKVMTVLLWYYNRWSKLALFGTPVLWCSRYNCFSFLCPIFSCFTSFMPLFQIKTFQLYFLNNFFSYKKSIYQFIGTLYYLCFGHSTFQSESFFKTSRKWLKFLLSKIWFYFIKNAKLYIRSL